MGFLRAALRRFRGQRVLRDLPARPPKFRITGRFKMRGNHRRVVRGGDPWSGFPWRDRSMAGYEGRGWRAQAGPGRDGYRRTGRGAGLPGAAALGAVEPGDRVRAGRAVLRHAGALPDGLSGHPVAQYGRPADLPAGDLRHRALRGSVRQLESHRQHRVCRLHRDGAGDRHRVSRGLDLHPDQPARRLLARTADAAALLHDAAGRRAGVVDPGGAEYRLSEPALARGRRRRRSVQRLFAVGHRLGHGAVRGHRRVRDDLGGDEVDGPGARRGRPRARRRQMARHADRDIAAGHAGGGGRRGVCLRRDAGFVRRGLRARHPGPVCRHHHRDLAGGDDVSGRLRPRRGARHRAVRGDVPDA